jgi:tetratricopeptide (TPR) repeat protein
MGRVASHGGAGVAETGWRARWPALLVALLALAVFAPALRNGFTSWDDTVYALANPNLSTLGGLWRIWTTLENEQYYPLTWSLNWLEGRLLGSEPAGWHAVSLVLHAANCALLVLVLRALGLARWPALGVACLWAIHPTHVMSVAWIAERKNQLSLVFVLLALLAWLRPEPCGGRRSQWLATAAFAAALLAKSQVIGLPLALLVLDRFWLGRTWRTALARVAPMLVLCVISVFVTRLYEERYLDPYTLASMPAWPERIQVAGGALWRYVGKALVPWPLAPFYPLWKVSRGELAAWLPCAAAVTAIVLLAWRAGRIDGRVLFGLALFALMLAPVLGFVPYANLPLTYVSDHYLYAATVGLAVALAVVLQHLTARGALRGMLAGVLGVWGVLLVVATESYIPAYRSPETFWVRALESSPDCYAAQLGLAEVLSGARRVEEALPHYQRALELRPDWIDAHQMLGTALARAGDLAGAERSLRRALELAPGNARALCGLGEVLERSRRPAEALSAFERAVQSEPGSRAARMGLGRMHLGYGRYAEAEAQFRALVAREPEVARAWLGIATSLSGRGRDAEAVASLREGLAHAAGDVDLRNMLAWLVATSRDDRTRDGGEALRLAQEVNRETARSDHELLDTLAAALAEVGRFEDALAVAREAGELAARRGETLPPGERERRVESYARRQPWRR